MEKSGCPWGSRTEWEKLFCRKMRSEVGTFSRSLHIQACYVLRYPHKWHPNAQGNEFLQRAVNREGAGSNQQLREHMCLLQHNEWPGWSRKRGSPVAQKIRKSQKIKMGGKSGKVRTNKDKDMPRVAQGLSGNVTQTDNPFEKPGCEKDTDRGRNKRKKEKWEGEREKMGKTEE